ncbi:MAG TPA: dihydrolipoyl dehydrogenase [Bacteroidota bacterium]|nr:dihydrolipoyl dehydrogenase [Bacteroidota bacterium]
MPDLHYTLLVIGGGPGGYTAAIRGAQLGMRTAVVERERLGGICLNWGCIPTKALLKNAEVLQTFRRAAEWGISVENLRFDFPSMIRRSRAVADRIVKGVEYLMKKNRIDVIPGRGRIAGAGTVEVIGGEGAPATLRADHVIIATGARPRSLPGVTIDGKRVMTSTEAMSLPAQPASIVIVGAGAIGVEFAWFYNALGTKVTLVEMLPGILPVEDRELTRTLETSLRKQGIEILTGTAVESVRSFQKGVTVSVRSAEGEKRDVTADAALIAVGVEGNVEDLGLEAAGAVVGRGRITVDADYRTAAPGVYAIGDVIGPPWLAHVASAEGIHCVEAIAGKHPPALDYSAIPGCTYCQPQIASVGLTEEKALAAGHELKIGRFPFRPLGKAVAIGETEGMVKLIFDAKYGELLGAHILGAEATEMIAELAVAKRLETTAEGIFRTVHAHPTLGEAVMEAAAAAYGEAVNI